MEQCQLSKSSVTRNFRKVQKWMAHLRKETISFRYTISYTDVMEYCPHCLFIDHCFMNKKKLMLCTLEKCAKHIIRLDHTRGYPPPYFFPE
jgi:hypothetical protein